MLRLRKHLSLVTIVAGTTLAVATLGVLPAVSAVSIAPLGLSALIAPKLESGTPVGNVAVSFVRAMSAGDAEKVWMFASEEDQDAFGTEPALLKEYADIFPALAQAKDVTVEKSWQEGDTPFVEARIEDRDGKLYRATMGFWLDDAGDWELVSCEVKPLSDQVAQR